MIYCISDIHGDYEKYIKMLDKIHLSDEDTLYVLGDVVDRGSSSMKVLKDMMLRPNVIPLIGNHEYMAIQSLSFLMRDITEESIEDFSPERIQGLLEWQRVGGQTTIDEFSALSYEEKIDILEYLEEFSLYEEIKVNEENYVLVHAGLLNFAVERSLDDYELYEMIFEQPDYSREYYVDKYLITGHTPTRNIENNPRPDEIYRANRHIAIDCGCGYGGRLGVICLDTGEIFYI